MLPLGFMLWELCPSLSLEVINLLILQSITGNDVYVQH